MHESALTLRNKEEGASEDNEDNNGKIIVQSDQYTYDYTLGGQLIMV